MKLSTFSLLAATLASATIFTSCCKTTKDEGLQILPIQEVKVTDSFWGPRLEQWNKETFDLVFDHFEDDGAFKNFDLVAEGQRDIDWHGGAPWHDGLVYETIRAAGDFIRQCPNPGLELRIDGYIDRIGAAQDNEGSGYINTYTMLTRNDKRWGQNGGNLRWQHDVYNSGALVDAGVHYYQATGKRKLLDIAIKTADYMCEVMGEYPKQNIVPAHSLPEEALVSLYQLTGQQKYLDLVKFWLGARGRLCLPDSSWTRRGFGAYSQDDKPLVEQTSIEGHAVRATLLYTGTADYTRVSGDTTYRAVVERIWDNMAGRKMMVTGAVGSIADDEKFGDDFFIPVNAYAETCAGVGLAFFSQQMNMLTGKAKYMDEFERALYNNILTGIALDGQTFTYVNPLNATNYNRWVWHGCPCCPPMFLKIMGALPSYIYGYDSNSIYVNLFIGSQATFKMSGKDIALDMETSYPWKGESVITVNPAKDCEFCLKLRIPGWAVGEENPGKLYNSSVKGSVCLKVNNEELPVEIMEGYACITKKWSAGDKVCLSIPVEPRIIKADERCNMGQTAAIGAGPLIYCFEVTDNSELEKVLVNNNLTVTREEGLLGGVNIISCGQWKAIPYYAVGNRQKDSAYTIWTALEKK